MRKFLLLVPAVLLVAGCGGGSKTDLGTTVNGVGAVGLIVVHESDSRLEPATIRLATIGTGRLGYYGIKVVNDGAKPHALQVKGHGVNKRTADIAPGNSSTIVVLFAKSGRYAVYSPVGNDARKGMKGTVIAP